MTPHSSLVSSFRNKDDRLVGYLLYEYKYLQSLQVVTRGITHSYNNILTGALGRLDSNSDKKGACEQHSTLTELINRGVKDTETLFGFARLKRDPKVKHSLSGILEYTLLALEAVSPKNSITIGSFDNFIKVNGCFTDLVLMFFYVAENSIEAMAHGGNVDFEVSTQSQEGGGWVQVIVRDNGPGVEKSIIDEMFEPFTGTKEGCHKGLGLYLARRIAAEHDGTLDVLPGGQGASFIFRLPRAETADHEEKEPVAEKKKAVREHMEFAKHVFFIIDDDPVLLDFLVNGLQRKGHIVFSASTCKEALEEFRLINKIITIFLVDIGLAGSDGFECVKQLSAVNDAPEVIFMSGDVMDGQADFPPDAGFLSKPFTVGQVEEMARTCRSQDLK